MCEVAEAVLQKLRAGEDALFTSDDLSVSPLLRRDEGLSCEVSEWGVFVEKTEHL
jgi:hypothetical protein